MFEKKEIELLLQALRKLTVNGSVADIARFYTREVLPLEQKLIAMKDESNVTNNDIGATGATGPEAR